LTRDYADAQEAVQEIFGEVWRSADRFDPSQGSERVFVATIARRRLVDRMRRAARTESDDIHSLSWGGNSGDPSAEAVAAARAVMRLRPDVRQVLELAILQGFKQAEIADMLELPVETIKETMLLGLVQMRELMSKQRAAGDEAHS
jgi:RNA polymerase sigma-70 factor (ECF subfamily)